MIWRKCSRSSKQTKKPCWVYKLRPPGASAKSRNSWRRLSSTSSRTSSRPTRWWSDTTPNTRTSTCLCDVRRFGQVDIGQSSGLRDRRLPPAGHMQCQKGKETQCLRNLLYVTTAVAAFLMAALFAAVPPAFVPEWTFQGSTLKGWHVLGQADWRARERRDSLVHPKSVSGGWLVLDQVISGRRILCFVPLRR